MMAEPHAAAPDTSPEAPSRRRSGPLRGDPSDLRAMKRALANAPLGPKATLALTHAIIALEDDLDTQDGGGGGWSEPGR